MGHQSARPRTPREIFLRRAVEAEMRALGCADVEHKIAWADIAGAWNALADDAKPENPKPTLGAALQTLAARNGEAVN